MTYLHFDLPHFQVSKKPKQPCGDVIACDRTEKWTIAIICDGLGSGIKANIAATMCAERLMGLLRRNFRFRDAVEHLVQTMHEAKLADLPYAAFIAAFILNNGETTIFNYEMPCPIFISAVGNYAAPLKQQQLIMAEEIVQEAHYFLDFQSSLLLISDGVSQAGLGTSFKLGWTIDGVCDYLNNLLRNQQFNSALLPQSIIRKVLEYGEGNYGDDVSALYIGSRPGKILNILTGPPTKTAQDPMHMQHFLAQSGEKIVCGNTTAKILANYLNQELQILDDTFSATEPPQFYISGIDLVTEGAITLNQVYNIIDEDLPNETNSSGVLDLALRLRQADLIRFTVGQTQNQGHDNLVFKRMGIINRKSIVPLLAEKLKFIGKLVLIEYI